MNLRRLINGTLIFGLALIVQACGVNDEEISTAQLRVGLTDAPAAYDQVNIEILQVLVNTNGDEDLEEGEETETDSLENNGWYAILEDSIYVNLLDYQNGAILDLGTATVEPGQYNQVRLLLGDNNNVVVDGITYDLKTPSAQQSGYKLQINETVEAGGVYDLIIDFDASRSVVQRGNGSYLLKPVLRTVDLDETGSISGTVFPADGADWVYAIHQSDADTVGTQPDDGGNFSLIGLQEGVYDLSIIASEAYQDSTIMDIELMDEDLVLQDTVRLNPAN
ncbi:DUF4382 domain-containing protein [Balneola sp. MJW-20]|uniref:DUF4382 domain-containing protein n=1 Tax=Gracilimonas aurantiaca TaxID=3234185 RepID=UPI00390989D4